MLWQGIHIITVILPLIMGFLSFLVKDKFAKQVNIFYLFIFSLFFIYILFSIFGLNLLSEKEYYVVIGGWKKAMGIELKYNLDCALVVLFLTLNMLIFIATTIKEITIKYAFRGFACIMLCGANGIALTNDIFNSYVFFEIICIVTYIMYSHGDNIICLKNTYNYIILSSIAGTIFLLVIGFLYQITGELNIDLIHEFISKAYSTNKSISAIYVLFLLCMMLKIGFYPFHCIMLEIYKNIPLKYLIFAAGTTSIAYPFFIVKFVVNLFGSEVMLNNEYVGMAIKTFGCVGFLFFIFSALAARNLINFIIFLSFSQTSLFTFFIPYLSEPQIKKGIIFMITSFSIIKVCIMALLNDIQTQTKNAFFCKEDVKYINNSSYRYLILILLFIISGMPLSLVFMSKWLILMGLVNSSLFNVLWISIIVVGFTIDIFACFMVMKYFIVKNFDDILLDVKTNYLLLSIIMFIIILLIVGVFFIKGF